MTRPLWTRYEQPIQLYTLQLSSLRKQLQRLCTHSFHMVKFVRRWTPKLFRQHRKSKKTWKIMTLRYRSTTVCSIESVCLNCCSLCSAHSLTGSLLEEAHSLKTSILELTRPLDLASTLQEKDSTGTPRSQILPMFSACLPVLRARVDNLTVAQQLVEGAKENYAMSLQMEILGLDDSEDDT